VYAEVPALLPVVEANSVEQAPDCIIPRVAISEELKLAVHVPFWQVTTSPLIWCNAIAAASAPMANLTIYFLPVFGVLKRFFSGVNLLVVITVRTVRVFETVTQFLFY
jgi:hypothetical protein